MNKLTQISLLAAGLAAAFPFVNAATPDAAAPQNDATTQAPAQNAPKHKGMLHHRRAIAHRVARKLNLNADQVAQLKTIRGSTHTTLKSIRANTALRPDEKKAQARAALQNSRTQMRALLTPEQQAKLDAMKDQAWQRQGGF